MATIALKIQKSPPFLALFALLVLRLDILLVELLLAHNLLGFAIVVLLFRLFLLGHLTIIILLHFHLIPVSFLDLSLSAEKFLNVSAFLSIVPSSFISVVLVKDLIVLLFLHLLNINIPALGKYIILRHFAGCPRGFGVCHWQNRGGIGGGVVGRLFQIENQYQLYLIEEMRLGHRRTRSANINGISLQDPLNMIQNLPSDRNNQNIIHLLQKSQFKAKQKVCSIEPLNSLPKNEQDKLFNFGKGLLKVELLNQQKATKQNALRSIPEKLKQHAKKTKKTAEAEPTIKAEARRTHQSVLKINSKDLRSKDSLKQGSNQTSKAKAVHEFKTRKLSVVEARCIAKSVKHRKDISNVK